MPIGYGEVTVTIEIEISKYGSKTQPLIGATQPGTLDPLGIGAGAIPHEKIVGLAGKIRDVNGQLASSLYISAINPHPRLGLPGGAEGDAPVVGDIDEGSISPVAPEEIRRGVIGDIEILQAISIEISGHDTKAFPIRRSTPGDTRLAAHILEAAVAPAPVEEIPLAVEDTGMAIHPNPVFTARPRKTRNVFEVAHHVEIRVPIIVIVQPGGACAEALSCEPGSDRYILEGPIPLVAVEGVAADIGHKEILVAIIIIVPHADPV